MKEFFTLTEFIKHIDNRIAKRERFLVATKIYDPELKIYNNDMIDLVINRIITGYGTKPEYHNNLKILSCLIDVGYFNTS